MSNSDGLPEVQQPPFVLAGVRTALEMLLVGIGVALIGLPAQNALYLAFIAVLSTISMVVVLFWGLNQQMNRCIQYAHGKPTMDSDGWF